MREIVWKYQPSSEEALTHRLQCCTAWNIQNDCKQARHFLLDKFFDPHEWQLTATSNIHEKKIS